MRIGYLRIGVQNVSNDASDILQRETVCLLFLFTVQRREKKKARDRSYSYTGLFFFLSDQQLKNLFEKYLWPLKGPLISLW